MERPLGKRRALAHALERGVSSASAGALAALWAWASTERARCRGYERVEGSAALIGVVGATLGGSWRTPFTLSLARSLASRGLRVGALSHGYAAKGLGRAGAVRVEPHALVESVGDEALLLARSLTPIPVASGPGAARLLAPEVEVLVADGRRGERRARTVLTLDGERPFGAGACPPAGDLRAPPHALLKSAGHIVCVVDPLGPGAAAVEHHDVHVVKASPVVPACVGQGRGWALLTAMARPDRLLRSLERRGVRPMAHLALPDHGALSERASRAVAALSGCEGVLMTEKCALRAPDTLAGRPVARLGLTLSLPDALLDALLSG